MEKRKLLSIVLCVVMIMTAGALLSACGRGAGESSADAAGQAEADDSGPGVVTSSGGIITIENTGNYTPKVSANSEKITLWKADREEGENDHFVEIEAAASDGSIFSASTVCRSYVQGSPYSMQALKEDLNSFIAEHPTIYSNPTDITLNGVTYVRTECTTNGADSYKIFGTVSGMPVIISVCDDRDSEDVQKMLDTLSINYSQG